MMLVAHNLFKKYGSLTVVNDVSLEIKKQEVIAIIGPSGAGKSTLLHLLGALDKPDAGSVLLDETNIFQLASKKQAQFRNQKIGFVFQFHHLLPEFTAIENVAMPLLIKGTHRKDAAAQALQMMHLVSLSGKEHNRPSELSGGEQQRVAIARAMVNKPAIIMADEPTGNLDSANARAIHQLFLELREKTGQTIVMITHNDALAAMADRTLIMRDGKIVEEKKNNI